MLLFFSCSSLLCYCLFSVLTFTYFIIPLPRTLFCRMKTPLPNPPLLDSFFKNNYSLNFLILFIIQAPPPPTSCPCAPVGCRAISLAVCLQPLFHRSTAHCLHMRKGDTHLHSYSLFLSLSLSLSGTRVHTPPHSLTSGTLLRKDGMKSCSQLLEIFRTL